MSSCGASRSSRCDLRSEQQSPKELALVRELVAGVSPFADPHPSNEVTLEKERDNVTDIVGAHAQTVGSTAGVTFDLLAKVCQARSARVRSDRKRKFILGLIPTEPALPLSVHAAAP